MPCCSSLFRRVALAALLLPALPAIAEDRTAVGSDPSAEAEVVSLAAEDDVTYRGTTRYNSSGLFGLFTKGNGTSDRAYVEFQFGGNPAASARLKLYSYWGAPQGMTVDYNVRIRGIGSADPGYVQWTDTSGPAPSGSAHEDGTAGNPLWPVAVDTFHVDSVPAWYDLDITPFYNVHLGEKVTFSIRALLGSSDGPIFVDREGTGGSQSPVVEVVPAGSTAPIIAEVTPDPDTVVIGTEYQRQLQLLAGSPPINWSVLTGPAGLQVDSSGRVSGWTPDAGQAGSTYPIEIEAGNAEGSDAESWLVQVVLPPPPVVQEFVPDPDSAVAGAQYLRQLVLLEGDPPVLWSVIQGPAGLVVDASGSLSGWTPAAGDVGQAYSIEIEAANDYGADRESWTVEVVPAATGVFPGASWEFRTPAEMGMDAARLDQIAATIGGNGCIVRKGYMVKTWGSQSTKADWASAAKPMISTMLFFAVQENLLSSVDDRVADWGWPLSTKDQDMRFRHLADMTGGYTRAEPGGAAWAYNDYGIRLYALTLFDRVFAQTPNAAATHPARLGALQFQDGSIFSSRGGYGLSTSVRDYARIGWFWANRGNWNGSQLLPQHCFDDYMRPDVPPDLPRTTASDPQGDYLGIGTYGGGSDQTPYGPGIYGFNWWFNAAGGIQPTAITWPDAPGDTFQANGHWGKEVLTVIPSLKTVMAYFGGATLSFQPGNPASSANQVLKLLAESVNPQPPAIAVSKFVIERVVDFSENPADDSFTVANAGDGILNYAAGVDQPWVSIQPGQGSASTESDTVMVSFSVQNLPAGTHAATITVQDTGSIPPSPVSPQYITVSLSIATVRPDLDFDGDVDQEDFGRLQLCLADPEEPTILPGCGIADLNQDLQVDQDDLVPFLECLSAPGMVADKTCDDGL